MSWRTLDYTRSIIEWAFLCQIFVEKHFKSCCSIFGVGCTLPRPFLQYLWLRPLPYIGVDSFWINTNPVHVFTFGFGYPFPLSFSIFGPHWPTSVLSIFFHWNTPFFTIGIGTPISPGWILNQKISHPYTLPLTYPLLYVFFFFFMVIYINFFFKISWHEYDANCRILRVSCILHVLIDEIKQNVLTYSTFYLWWDYIIYRCISVIHRPAHKT